VSRNRARTIALLLFMALLLFASLSRHFYRLSIPFDIPAQIYGLRKVESLLAFTVAGAIVGRSPWRGALIVGSFSCLIELLQHLHGSGETLVQMTIDVVLGAAGGALGAALRNRFTRSALGA
jgi:hypothetical protein